MHGTSSDIEAEPPCASSSQASDSASRNVMNPPAESKRCASAHRFNTPRNTELSIASSYGRGCAIRSVASSALAADSTVPAATETGLFDRRPMNQMPSGALVRAIVSDTAVAVEARDHPSKRVEFHHGRLFTERAGSPWEHIRRRPVETVAVQPEVAAVRGHPNQGGIGLVPIRCPDDPPERLEVLRLIDLHTAGRQRRGMPRGGFSNQLVRHHRRSNVQSVVVERERRVTAR